MYNLLDKYEYDVDVLARDPVIGELETPTRAVPDLARIARLFDVRVAEFCVLDVIPRDEDNTPEFVPRVADTPREETVLDAVPRDTVVLSVTGFATEFVARDAVDRDKVRLDVVVFERGL